MQGERSSNGNERPRGRSPPCSYVRVSYARVICCPFRHPRSTPTPSVRVMCRATAAAQMSSGPTLPPPVVIVPLTHSSPSNPSLTHIHSLHTPPHPLLHSLPHSPTHPLTPSHTHTRLTHCLLQRAHHRQWVQGSRNGHTRQARGVPGQPRRCASDDVYVRRWKR